MEKNIFNVYVEMESQEQCDRMKKLCIDNGLKIWDYKHAFSLIETIYFGYTKQDGFAVWGTHFKDEIRATETEFIELLKQYKDV